MSAPLRTPHVVPRRGLQERTRKLSSSCALCALTWPTGRNADFLAMAPLVQTWQNKTYIEFTVLEMSPTRNVRHSLQDMIRYFHEICRQPTKLFARQRYRPDS